MPATVLSASRWTTSLEPSQLPHEAGVAMVNTVPMRKWKLREAKSLGQGHTVSERG